MKTKGKLVGILIIMLMIACDKNTELTPDQLLSIKVTQDNIPADNFSFAEIVTQADPNIANDKRDVVFTTSTGMFSNGTATVTVASDISGQAKAYLKSSNVLPATVSAKLATTYTRQVTVNFIASFPDYITVAVPETAKNSLDSRFTVTAKFAKKNGTIQTGYQANFVAYDNNGKVMGIFNNLKPSEISGESSAEYYLNDPSFTGTLNIKAYLINLQKDSVIGKNQLRITN